jgi:hypothetical protein
MAKKRLSSGIIYEYLTKPSGKVLNTFKFRGHYSKFKFSHKSSSNIILVRFLSEGLSKQVFKYHIEGMLSYLNMTFETTGQLKSFQSDSTIELIFNDDNRSKTIIRFRYVSKIITTNREERVVFNRGQLYERSMINKFRSMGFTEQIKPEDTEDKADLVLKINGIDVKIELKTKGAAYGSGTLEWIDNSWRLKTTERVNPNLIEILNRNRILSKLSNDWISYDYIPNIKSTKEDQQLLGERTYPIDSYYIRNYYKGIDYLNFKDLGLYRLSEKDPIGLKVPLFEPMDCFVRARVQYKGSGNYRYAVELYARQLNKSPINLDGDLKFLEEINNNKPQV